MKRLIFIILLISLPLTHVSAGGACVIENGPGEKLKNYIQEVQNLKNTIASLPNACSGNFKQEKKNTSQIKQDLIQFYDEIDIQTSLRSGFMTDFLYNIDVTLQGNNRNLVIAQGKMIDDLEKTFQSAFESAANSCNLSTESEKLGNKTVHDILRERLLYQRKVSYYFKSVVIGDLAYPDGIESDDFLFQEIGMNYSEAMTSTCKNDSSFENILNDLQTRIESNTTGIKDATSGWKKAADMLAGRLSNTRELQLKLLGQELARQGLSQTAQSIIIGNFQCGSRDTNNQSSVNEQSVALGRCFSPIVNGLDHVINQIKKSYTPPNTIKRFTEQKQSIQTTAEILATITLYYGSLPEVLDNSAETTIDAQILSDLVSMHTQIVTTNALVKKKIPDMQRNCMKAGSTVGACR